MKKARRTALAPLALALAATPGCAPPPAAAASPPHAVATERPAEARAADERELVRLHAEVLENHRTANVDRWLSNEAEAGGDAYVVASRGALNRPTKSERRARLQRYLTSTTFREYRDLVAPIVKISRDGSLGWVIVQVHAEGVQRTEGREEPLEFTSAWVELYEKQGGRWVAVGNVSNFKELERLHGGPGAQPPGLREGAPGSAPALPDIAPGGAGEGASERGAW